MNHNFTILRTFLLVLIIIGGLSLLGCESDPILSPQVEVEEEGGSYGNTNLPPDQNTGNANKVNQSNKIDSNVSKKTNPTLF